LDRVKALNRQLQIARSHTSSIEGEYATCPNCGSSFLAADFDYEDEVAKITCPNEACEAGLIIRQVGRIGYRVTVDEGRDGSTVENAQRRE
jgi:hypothetical protein